MRSLALILISLLVAILPISYMGLWKQEGKRWLGYWALLTSAAFLCGHYLVFSIVIWIASVQLVKKMPDRVPTIYALLLPLIPTYTYILSGIPGINMLFALDYVRLLSIFLLLPAYFAARQKAPGKPDEYSTVDICFILYCMWWIVAVFANLVSVTDVIRQTFEIVVFTLLPYLALRKLLRTKEQLRDLILAIVFTGIVVSCVCVIEIVANRTQYADLATRLSTEPLAGSIYIKQYRFGLLRVRGTMEGGLTVFAVFALGALLCLSKMEKIAKPRLWTGIALLAIPTIFSGSRGTWIMAGLVLATWIGFSLIKTTGRFVTAMIVVFAVTPGIQSFLMNRDDPFGTFVYRQRLLDTFMPVVWEKPLVGWNTLGSLYSTGRFDHLVQGQSIIDMVNTFLSEALLRGVPGFLLFSGIFAFSVISTLRKLQRIEPSEADFYYPVVKWICSFMPAVAFLLITTSPVGHTLAYIALAAAIASAVARMGVSRIPSRALPTLSEADRMRR